MKLQKITNPLWLPAIAPKVDEFAREINSPAVSYQSLFMYFQQAVQYGQNMPTQNEFWVVVDDNNEPQAFAHWYVCGLPQAGMVFCDFVYSWIKDRKPIELIMQEFIKFGKRNRCTLYDGMALDEKRYRLFRRLFAKYNMNVERKDYVNFIGRLNK